MITQGHKQNFEMLKLAFANQHTALVSCTSAKTGEVVIAVCAINQENGMVAIIPLAALFNGNPYEELVPPTLESGGFMQ